MTARASRPLRVSTSAGSSLVAADRVWPADAIGQVLAVEGDAFRRPPLVIGTVSRLVVAVEEPAAAHVTDAAAVLAPPVDVDERRLRRARPNDGDPAPDERHRNVGARVWETA